MRKFVEENALQWHALARKGHLIPVTFGQGAPRLSRRCARCRVCKGKCDTDEHYTLSQLDHACAAIRVGDLCQNTYIAPSLFVWHVDELVEAAVEALEDEDDIVNCIDNRHRRFSERLAAKERLKLSASFTPSSAKRKH